MGNLLSVFSPLDCALCGVTIEWWDDKGIPLCDYCRSKIPLLSGVRCRICSIPLISEVDTCLRCRERDFGFDAQRALMMYSGVVKDLVSSFKTDGYRRLARWFADLLYQDEWLVEGNPCVVSVPFRPAARRKRGWDPVTEITRQLEKRHGVSIRTLLKRKDGISQKSLDFPSRLVNLSGKISLVGRIDIPELVILIDDVFTTGATLHECACVLKRQGATSVRALTLALDA